MHGNHAELTPLGRALLSSKLAQLGEFVVVFGTAIVVILAGLPWAGDDPLRYQALAWVPNILMLLAVWLGLRLRGQTSTHFGLPFRSGGRRAIVRGIGQSIVICFAAAVAFFVAAVVMANLTSRPEGADLSGYDYLRGNLPRLLMALAGIYFISSFGEEVIYRGFLMNRIAEFGGSGNWAWCAAVILSSVIFGFIHSPWGIVGVVQTGAVGVALGIAYVVVRRNLWANVLAHAYMDTMLLVPLYLGPT
jgi:membrane protease YdiL (CAAX protease family)